VLNANEWFRNATGISKARRFAAECLLAVLAAAQCQSWVVSGSSTTRGVRARNGIDPNASALFPTIQAFPTNPDGTTTAALLASAAYPGQTVQLTAAQIDPVAVKILNVNSTLYAGQFLVPRPGGADPSNRCLTPALRLEVSLQLSTVSPIYDNQYTTFMTDNGARQR